MSVLKRYQESLVIDCGIDELKDRIDKKEKTFSVKWLSDSDFKISLNFSVGTNSVFDINNDSKSAISADGILIELTENKTQIDLSTKFKYGLIIILFIPVIMLILELTMDLGIPVPLYFVFPLAFILVLYFFRSEEKRLIGYFKSHIGITKNPA
jgi:hypothetical protein